MVIISVVYGLGYFNIINKYVGPYVEGIFYLPRTVTPALIVGSMSGFPVGAQMIKQLYDDKMLSKRSAEQALMFCSNAGPAFIFGVVGNELFRSNIVATAIWLIHITGAICVGILTRQKDLIIPSAHTTKESTHLSLSQTITISILSSGMTVFKVCIYIVFFSILNSHLQNILSKSKATFLITGILELTNGILQLKDCNRAIMYIVATALLAWNGLCIHCQVLSLIYESSLSSHKYFQGKLLHLLISTSIAFLTAPFLFRNHVNVVTFSLIAIVCLLLIVLLDFITKTSSGNRKKYGI